MNHTDLPTGLCSHFNRLIYEPCAGKEHRLLPSTSVEKRGRSSVTLGLHPQIRSRVGEAVGLGRTMFP